MKQVLSLLVVLAVLTSCNKEEIIGSGDLPSEISEYVTTHFPNNVIIQSIEDKDGFTKTYDVILEGSISLEFNRKKEIIEIDGVSELPKSVIPTKISAYVEVNYPTNFITDWELDDKNQQIELDNEMDLEFNMDGDFLKIDS
ncbi:PepSY-like domain-containing protein [Brumimicrobium mesophilum]|uniref:PepSY-like domain-containing protein n=1 Tax=Brumimicrobium mesophilum TaxID=392717 RepID=UPI000D143BFF|nr:PepSY-like domain-containing protein [Brumimicrobium mesophilum]